MLRTLIKTLSAGLLALTLSFPVFALSLDEAKSSGLVGERTTGYLGIVTSSPDAELKNLVNRINEKRRALYQQRASKAGVTLDIMEMRIGQRLQEKAAPGEYIQDANGQWERK